MAGRNGYRFIAVGRDQDFAFGQQAEVAFFPADAVLAFPGVPPRCRDELAQVAPALRVAGQRHQAETVQAELETGNSFQAA